MEQKSSIREFLDSESSKRIVPIDLVSISLRSQCEIDADSGIVKCRDVIFGNGATVKTSILWDDVKVKIKADGGRASVIRSMWGAVASLLIYRISNGESFPDNCVGMAVYTGNYDAQQENLSDEAEPLLIIHLFVSDRQFDMLLKGCRRLSVTLDGLDGKYTNTGVDQTWDVSKSLSIAACKLEEAVSYNSVGGEFSVGKSEYVGAKKPTFDSVNNEHDVDFKKSIADIAKYAKWILYAVVATALIVLIRRI